MKVFVVLPPTPTSVGDLTRRLGWVRRCYQGASISLAAVDDLVAHYSTALDERVLPYDRSADHAGIDVMVLVRGTGDPDCGAYPLAGFGGRLYAQERDGRLNLLNQRFDQTEIPDIEAHAFSRLAPRNQAGYYFFPYGYGAHWPGMGPTDSFGFRGQTDWHGLGARGPSHRLVVVSGGSASWSQCCLPDEAFSAVLEARLNAWSHECGSALRFSVVNLGLFGNLVIHQMINYLLFAERARPDFVIAHDGFNDLLFGQVSDPWLLSEHAIAYEPVLERWSQLLFNSRNDALTQQTEPYTVLNLPHQVIGAYVQRKSQFMRIVEASGAGFIWGFQPCLFSKGGLSPQETDAERARHAQYEVAHRKIGVLYEQFSEIARLPAGVRIVDCHKAFGAFGVSEHLFRDYAHTTPAGDQRLADLYFEELRWRLESDVAADG